MEDYQGLYNLYFGFRIWLLLCLIFMEGSLGCPSQLERNYSPVLCYMGFIGHARSWSMHCLPTAERTCIKWKWAVLFKYVEVMEDKEAENLFHIKGDKTTTCSMWTWTGS